MKPITRRDILSCSGGLAGAVAVGLPLAESAAEEQRPAKEQKLKVVVVGGHPDDPESGCGGTMARYAEQGHEVVALYLTRNEAGALGAWARAEGKTREEAQQIATAEAEAACRILGARPMFVGQIDGDTEVNRDRYASTAYQVALRSLHEVFEADRREIVRAVSLQVGSDTVDPATGNSGFIPFVAVAAYGDGGPWYIPVKEEYPKGGYEVSVALCEPEVDSILTAGMRSLLG